MSESIVFVVGANQIGGAERQVHRLQRGLRDLGHTCDLLFLERPGRRAAGLRAVPLASPDDYLWQGKGTRWVGRYLLKRKFRRQPPDVVHAYNLEAGEFVAPIARDAGVPCVLLSVRGLLFERDEGVARRLRALSRRVDGVTTNCRAIETALRQSALAAACPIRVLPNLVPTPNQARVSVEARQTILFVGSLKPVKDPLTFLRACEIAMARNPRVDVAIAGGGPMKQDLVDYLDARGMSSRVRLWGELSPEEIPYSSASLLVSTSRSEGASNALLEAMAEGVPVVATSVGGSVEVVEDSGAGRLVPVESPERVAEVLLELLGDVGVREEMSERGRAYIAQRHSADAVLRDHLAVYSELTRGAGEELRR